METKNRWTIAYPGRAVVFKEDAGWRAVLAGGSVTTHFTTHSEAFQYAFGMTVLFRDYWHPGWRRERAELC